MIQIGNAYIDPTFGTGLFLLTTSAGAISGYLLIKGLHIFVECFGGE
jgi:hypothetical protein